jgi:hypothetical protein
MRLTLRGYTPAIGYLLAAIALVLVIASRTPLYGQAGDSWVPDLRGTWNVAVMGYGFEDVTDPNSQSGYFYSPTQSDQVVITQQTERVFAGIIDDPNGDDGKLVGVILPDRTVSIQVFDPSEVRLFATGRLEVSGRQLQISGYGHMFDEFGIREFPDKTMSTVYIRLVKMN